MVIKQEFTFPSSDGVHTVAAAWWRPEGPPRGVVQLVHGISEHIGRYDSFARFLAEHGFAVVGHDHLGHGRPARNPSEFGWFADRDGWKHVVKDVRALRERVGAEYPGLPCFLLGHSMGSFVVRGYLMFWPGTVDGAILSGTGQEPPATVAAGRALSALLIYGVLMNVSSALLWQSPVSWATIGAYLLSGFPVDCVHAAATVCFLWLFGEPMLEKLDRIKVKYGLLA